MKNRFTEFFKSKGYYVMLFVGVIAIAAVAVIGSNLSDHEKDNDNYVDLNEPDNNIDNLEKNTQLSKNNNQASENIANPKQSGNAQEDAKTTDKTTDKVAENEKLLEYDMYSKEGESGTDLSKETASNNVAKEEKIEKTTEDKKKEEPPAVETTSTSVQADTKKAMEKLSFEKEDGLLWPVIGNVIMNYSMDHTIYHATLMLYKCNPAIIIDAEVGTEVKAAARGIVTDIEDNEETGHTVTVSIGDGYQLVYGQLDKETLNIKVGDEIKAGDIIGVIAEPTKYYSVEGSNLYFEVLENEATVNPMSLLR